MILLNKDWFVRDNLNKKVEDFYDFDVKKLIGSGAYGDVIKATVKGGQAKRAIKIIKKTKVQNPERFKMEIDIMKQLDHPNVIKLFEVFEDNRYVYLVMELCEGGELFDKIIEKGHFTESIAKYYFKQMMLALNYIHSKNIVHRDLKPENFLLLDSSEKSPLKIIDFGLSIVLDKLLKADPKAKVSMKTKAGTPYYISPEVLKGDYDISCDIWSSGVILYILLSGVPPFFGNTDQDILNMVKSEKFSFNIPEFKVVSDSAKDLISKMITKPKIRLTANQTLDHPWLKNIDNKDEQALSINMSQLKGFQTSNRFKKAVLTFIATQLNATEIQTLAKEFQKLDKNNDGVLSIEEIKSGLKECGKMNQKEIQDLCDSIDTDGSGSINYTEFIAATIEKNVYLKEDKLYQAFKMFDIDGSGFITADELQKILGSSDEYKNMDKNYFQEILKENDKNGDGFIDYQEFIEMMSKANF